VALANTWIYLVGPLVGALIARIMLWVHRIIFMADAGRVLTMYRNHLEDVPKETTGPDAAAASTTHEASIKPTLIDPLAPTAEDLNGV
jgi:hypothetical protein